MNRDAGFHSVRAPTFCQRRIERQLNRQIKLALIVADYVPVRLDADGLMDQLEAALGLADGFDRVRPQMSRPVES